MRGVNEGRQYEIQADGVVKKDATGVYVEEYRWSNFVSDGRKTELSDAGVNFRQLVSLDPQRLPSPPKLSQADLRLVGPITDFMTCYADLWLATRLGKLSLAGDHFYFKHGTPNSWADGTSVLVGEDAIDFDMTLKSMDTSQQTATLLVRHVPPENPNLKLPTDWMHKPVADTANNWVQVQKTKDGKFSAAVGKETFDVEMTLSLKDGKILAATIENPVLTVERECADAALTSCGDPKPRTIRRHIELSLVQ